LGTKRKILDLWLRGIVYREIHARTSTSLGAISEIINSYKSEHSDLEQFQALGSKLPSDLDFAQFNSLFDSVTGLRKQLKCKIEDVPGLLESKITLINEIDELKQERDSAASEL
jgi:hypothetical protein